MTLRRYRMVPSTPTSLEKLARRLSSVTTTWFSSTPTRDHVPKDTYVNLESHAGTATTAEAVVNSAPIAPVSQYATRSGISKRVRAAASWAVPPAATIWNTVFSGRNWMPVTAYSSVAGTVASTLAITPSVRESR